MRENAFCMVFHEMDFSPLVSESHPRRVGRDSETRGEKNPSHMENHTKCISSYQNVNVSGGLMLEILALMTGVLC